MELTEKMQKCLKSSRKHANTEVHIFTPNIAIVGDVDGPPRAPNLTTIDFIYEAA